MTPWTAACQASLSFTISQNLLKLIRLMLFNHLILCYLLLLLPSIFSSIRVFSSVSALHIRWPKYWSFSISPSNEYSGVISFRIDWFDLLAVQGTLKILLHHYNSKASILQHPAFFMVQLLHLYISHNSTYYNSTFTYHNSTTLTRWSLVSKVMSLLCNTLSRFVIFFLPRTKCHITSWLQLPSSVIFEPKERKSVTASTFSPSVVIN